MADLALRRATSLPRGNKRDYVSYKTLVRWHFACALCGGARGFWFIDPLRLRPHGLCTVATRARHVNHMPLSYNYNICTVHTKSPCIGTLGWATRISTAEFVRLRHNVFSSSSSSITVSDSGLTTIRAAGK